MSPPQPSAQGLLLTVETICTTFLDGRYTPVFPPGAVLDAKQTAISQHVGLRRMWSNRFRTGVDFGFGLPSRELYNFSFLMQLQWVY